MVITWRTIASTLFLQTMKMIIIILIHKKKYPTNRFSSNICIGFEIMIKFQRFNQSSHKTDVFLPSNSFNGNKCTRVLTHCLLHFTERIESQFKHILIYTSMYKINATIKKMKYFVKRSVLFKLIFSTVDDANNFFYVFSAVFIKIYPVIYIYI